MVISEDILCTWAAKASSGNGVFVLDFLGRIYCHGAVPTGGTYEEWSSVQVDNLQSLVETTPATLSIQEASMRAGNGAVQALYRVTDDFGEYLSRFFLWSH